MRASPTKDVFEFEVELGGLSQSLDLETTTGRHNLTLAGMLFLFSSTCLFKFRFYHFKVKLTAIFNVKEQTA